MKAGRFYVAPERAGGRVQCTLCPHRCSIADGRRGICGVRQAEDGKIVLPFFGAASALAVDPIEKKPLYHFYPGSSILSIGFLGCSLRCPFCQNYEISQQTTRQTSYVSPEELVAQAQDAGSAGIAYTYNEPTVHLEYVLETAHLAREAGLKNVLVTAGYLNGAPTDELFSVVDAANVDLKTFQANRYQTELGADLEPVLAFIRAAARRIHVEVTTLVVPDFNASEAEIAQIAGFVAECSPDIPLHLSAYFPHHKLRTRPTEAGEIVDFVRVARRHLSYVYEGNTGGPADTRCGSCNAVLVARRRYHIDTTGLSSDGRCNTCGAATPIVVE